MRNKLVSLLLAFGIAFAVGGCSYETPSAGNDANSPSTGEESNTPSTENGAEEGEIVKNVAWYTERGYQHLFKDPYMKNGISVLSVKGDTREQFKLTGSYESPSWTFAQWHSKYDLQNYKTRRYEKGGSFMECISYGKEVDGKYVPGKVLKIETDNPSIYMELNAQVEFDAPKQDGEGWPHTLVSQDFSGELVHVSELSELIMNMDYTITKFEDKMGSAANPAAHCAQLVWYITLQNRTKGSEGYGQYIWFGLNLWDNRKDGGVSPEYAAQDLGKEDSTKAFIYQPSSEKIFAEKKMPRVGEKRELAFSVLATTKYAFELAKARGYLPDTSWEDIYIGSMNFGFENTGIYNTAVQIDTVGVYYKYLGE
ncbi:MAG: hypothetical protein IJ329_02455 [Clostridia bacterium]|nr:hypothetical protein [Clostridia bacterium]